MDDDDENNRKRDEKKKFDSGWGDNSNDKKANQRRPPSDEDLQDDNADSDEEERRRIRDLQAASCFAGPAGKQQGGGVGGLLEQEAGNAQWSHAPDPGQAMHGYNNTGAGSSSSSSSATQPRAYRPAPLQPGQGVGGSSSSSTRPPNNEITEDCPICFEAIEMQNAVMRCKTTPRAHYFHSHCLQEWVRSARAANVRPTCPICRNDVEFNAQNLSGFLNSAEAENLTEEERGFFQSIQRNLSEAAKEGWSHVTWENVQYAGGLIAMFGWGFYTGYNHDRMYYPVDLLPMSAHNRAAQGIGWFVGLIAREVKRYNENKNDRRRR